jgi:hypothetical protein
MYFQLNDKNYLQLSENKGFYSLSEIWKNNKDEYKPNWVKKVINGEEKVVPASVRLGTDREQIRAFAKWLYEEMK